MPQLDLMHFFTQFFWFSFGFTFLYAYILHNVMPLIAYNLKFRQKKLSRLALEINEGKEGVLHLFKVYDSLVGRAFSFWKINFVQLGSEGSTWVLVNNKKLNNAIFREANSGLVQHLIEGEAFTD